MNDFELFRAFLNEVFPWVKAHCNGDTSDRHYDEINKELSDLGKKYKTEPAYYGLCLKGAEVIYSELRGKSE